MKYLLIAKQNEEPSLQNYDFAFSFFDEEEMKEKWKGQEKKGKINILIFSKTRRFDNIDINNLGLD